MNQRLLDAVNPNKLIFEIPTQEGSSEEDVYCASIGDAVAQHVYSLSHSERQLWEELIHTSDGNLFRPIPSLDSADRDDVDEEELKRREESEDVLDQCELVPYAEWEKFPQMWNTIDIPNTPKDKMMYCGNTRQMFYDVFPEGHPDALFINNVLSRVVGRDDINNNYGNWVIEYISEQLASKKVQESVAFNLARMVCNIVADPLYAEQYVTATLKIIDGEWANEFKDIVKQQFINDATYRLLTIQKKEWEERYKAGESVYADVKTFGQLMFHDPELRSQMNAMHWHMYREMKRQFAPKVVVRGYDINRCSRGKIQAAFKCDQRSAREIWHARPFENVDEIYFKSLINKEAFGGTEDADKVVNWIEKTTQTCMQNRSLLALTTASKRMTQAQADGKIKFSDDEWRMLWVYMRVCKEEVINHLNNKGE